jgi:hypothetical protein
MRAFVRRLGQVLRQSQIARYRRKLLRREQADQRAREELERAANGIHDYLST